VHIWHFLVKTSLYFTTCLKDALHCNFAVIYKNPKFILYQVKRFPVLLQLSCDLHAKLFCFLIRGRCIFTREKHRPWHHRQSTMWEITLENHFKRWIKFECDHNAKRFGQRSD